MLRGVCPRLWSRGPVAAEAPRRVRSRGSHIDLADGLETGSPYFHLYSPGLALSRGGSLSCSSSPVFECCWTSNCPACSKIEGGFKSQSIEIYWSEQRSALGCLSDQRLTEKQHQGNISQSIYRYCVDLCHFLVGRQNRPTLLQHSSPLSTDTKHSTVMYVCGGIFPTSPWYRMFSQCVLLCFLCACSFFKLPLCGFSSVHISYSS